jgi:hypothetical protein
METATIQVPAGQKAALLAAAAAAGITVMGIDRLDDRVASLKARVPSIDNVPNGCHVITDDRGVKRLARMSQAEYDNWRNQTRTTIYSDLKIVPKRDFGESGYYDSKTRANLREGWVVVYTRGPFAGCNAIPGAGWSYTHDGAMDMIHAFIAAGGNTAPEKCEDNDPNMAQRFHALVRLTGRDN